MKGFGELIATISLPNYAYNANILIFGTTSDKYNVVPLTFSYWPINHILLISIEMYKVNQIGIQL